MCIICAKPAKTAFPDAETIRIMWHRNPDGAGIMYARDGKVCIEKGFMKLSDFENHLDKLRKSVDLNKTAVVMHFRITTHGGTTPANTHPFPVTDSITRLQATRTCSTVGVAHNGIIRSVSPRKGISDTMEYIATQLAPLSRALPDWYHNCGALTLVQNAIDSKLAVLTGAGEIITVGDFETENGIMYSNGSFRSYGGRYANISMYDWDYDWEASAFEAYVKNTAKTTAKKGKKKKGKKAESINIFKQPLMRLVMADEGAYVRDEKNGYITEGLDFLLDSNNGVWVYDIALDACMKMPGHTAYTAQGAVMRYNGDLADGEYCVI